MIQHHLGGARSGKGDDMKPSFPDGATTFAHVGSDLFGGPIQRMFDWRDQNGPAIDLQAHNASIDITGSGATVRLELDNWTGHRFTDIFTLLKVDGEWNIISRVFHLHGWGRGSTENRSSRDRTGGPSGTDAGVVRTVSPVVSR